MEILVLMRIDQSLGDRPETAPAYFTDPEHILELELYQAAETLAANLALSFYAITCPVERLAPTFCLYFRERYLASDCSKSKGPHLLWLDPLPLLWTHTGME